ncbi:TIGR02217 family protein [Palleronia sp.]|uniref:phage distal tail protein, Rcc01695 family n=1 Tax=Palleronia sp. TaxID=1940284 RepID=UPI0035C86A31
MAFHEERCPADLSFGAVGGPERRTEIVTLANGFEERNTTWAHSRRRYDVGFGLRSMEDVELLIAFFEARRGRLHGFRWKDWADYSSALGGAAVSFGDQKIGTGDGTSRAFHLSKTYGVGRSSYVRLITKPVAGSVRVGVDGVEIADFDVDHTTGAITLPAAPALGVTVTAGFLFDVPVRFDTDRIDISLATFNAGQVPDVPVVELRV